jgi:hypothetical protein
MRQHELLKLLRCVGPQQDAVIAFMTSVEWTDARFDGPRSPRKLLGVALPR